MTLSSLFSLLIDQLFFKWNILLHQEEEEAAEREEEAEGESRAEDGPARRVHRQHRRHVFVLPVLHQKEKGKRHTNKQINRK